MSEAPLRIVLADDEPLALERLVFAFGDVPMTEIVGTATNGIDALAEIRAKRPDIAVLDIQMPGRSGLGVVAELPLEDRPEIIFLTAYDSHAVDAFDLEAADYLMKPLRLDRLRRAVDRIRRRRAPAPDAAAAPPAEAAPQAKGEGFWVQGRHGMFLVALADVVWVEAAKDYVMIHTAQRSFILRTTMSAVARQFEPEQLMRVHRSALVRPDRVRALRHTGTGMAALILDEDIAVQVGPTYMADVTRRFALDMGEE